MKPRTMMPIYKESKVLRENKRPVLLQKYIEKGIKGAVDDFILDWDYRDFYISDPCSTTTYMGNDATEDFMFDIGFNKIKFEVEAIEPLDVSSRGMMSNDNQIKLTLNIYGREGEYEKTFTTHAFGVYDTTLEWFIDCLFGDGIWVDENETNINNLNENKTKRNAMRRRTRLSENKLPSYSKFTKRRMIKENRVTEKEAILDELDALSEHLAYQCYDGLGEGDDQIEVEEDGTKVAWNSFMSGTDFLENQKLKEYFEKDKIYEFRVFMSSVIDAYDEITDVEVLINDEVVTSKGYFWDDIAKSIYNYFLKDMEENGFFKTLKESRSKTIRSKRRMIKESKERPTKKDIEEAIYNLAVSLASDLASGSFDKDENTLYKGATVWAKDEVENEYILDWLEYNGYDSINANVAGTYEYKNEYFEMQIGDRDYYPCHYFMDGEEDYQGFIESIEEDLTREFTNYNDIFELLNDEYYDDFYGESRKCKKLARKTLRESNKRGLNKKALFEKKLTKEYVLDGIDGIAQTIVEGMGYDYEHDAENIVNGSDISETYGSYYYNPRDYYDPFARYLSMYKEWVGVAIQWNYKEDKDGSIDFDFSDAKIGFGEYDYILHDSFNPKSTSYKDIKQEIIDYIKEALVNLGYLDEALVESKRKSFRGGLR